MSTTPESQYRVDRNTLRINQAFIVGLTALAVAIGGDVGRWLVLLTGLVLAAGTVHESFALFKQTHRRVLKPLGIVGSRVTIEDPMPHQFAQAVGAVFLIAATIALFSGAWPLGWALTLIVTALAFINLAVEFCAGCFVYLQLDRRGLLPQSIASNRAVRT